MANVKVSELTAATTLDEDDLLCSVDTSDSETKKITYGNFLRTVPDGTAAAPSIANAGDADTGILFPSDNTVAISCGGTQRFSVDGSGNVSISGTLTVSGSTTTIESTTLTVDDKNIELGSVATPTDTTADGGGITLKGATDHTIIWTNSTDSWDFSEHVNAASGKEFKIAGTSVLSATTLGSGVTSSSLTSVGTLGSLAVTNNITVGGTVDGRDLATDGSKLDGIESGATADQTASEILTAIKTVDGSGTGLDADLLDGVEASSFLRSDAADVKSSGSLRFDDGVQLELGDGSDLAIYHDGSNSYIQDTGTGNLTLLGSRIILKNAADNERMLDATQNGAVEILHDNSVKFTTKSDGIDVTGEVQCDSLDVDGVVDITGNVTLHANLDLQDDDQLNIGSGNDFTIRHDGTHSIFENDTGHLYVSNYANDQDIILRSDDGSGGIADYFRCDGSTGEVKLYYYGSQKLNTKSDGVNIVGELQCDSLDVDGAGDISGNLTVDSGTLFVDSVNNRVGVGMTSPGGNLHVQGATGDAGRIYLTDGDNPGSANSTLLAKSGATTQLRDRQSGSSMSFWTADTQRLTIDSSGRLLVGGTSEAHSGTIAQIQHTGNAVLSFARNDSSISDGNGLGQIDFYGNDGGTFQECAKIVVQADGTHANNDKPSRMAFYTTADNASSSTERLRITSTGAWAIEGASNYGSSGQVLTSNGNDSPTWQDVSAVAGTQIVNGTSNVSVLSDANIQFTRGGTLQVQVDGSGLLFQDNKKARFGGSADLEIYHDGSNSRINNNVVGSLVIKNEVNDQDIVLSSDNGSGGTTTYVRCDGSTGEVQLMHYGTEKFNTKSDGIDVTGEVQCDSLDVDGAADISGSLTIGTELNLIGTAGAKYIDANTGASGTLAIRLTSGGDTGHSFAAQFTRTGAVTLYHNGGIKLRTQSFGVDITGELQCDSLDVDGAANITGNLDISTDIRHNTDVDTYFGFPEADTFRVVTGGTERFRITSTGAIAIEGSSNYGTSGQVLTSNGNDAPTWQDAGGSGKILQVVGSTQLSTGNTSSTSTLLYNSTTVSITPSSSSSKILFIYSQGIQVDVDNDGQGANNGFVQYEYKIGSGSYTSFLNHRISARGGNNMGSTDILTVSPNTTSTVTFRIGIRKHEGSRAITFTNIFGANKVTLMEIAG